MTKKLIDVLRLLAQELIEEKHNTEEIVRRVSVFDIDFVAIEQELSNLEFSQLLDDAELDTIRLLLAYILMKDTDLDPDSVYSYVFCRGRHIIWQ